MSARLWIGTAVASVAAATVTPATLRGQHGAAPVAIRPPREASQYDFLVGQWDLTVTAKVSGLVALVHGVPKLRGSWKAWRALEGWGIEDELRVVDESGNPQALTHFVRVYDPREKHWTVSAVDAYRQQMTQSTAQCQGDAMVATGTSTDAGGRTFVSRTRLGSITPSSFHFQQDRSYDGGKTWEEARLVIDAARVAAAAPR